MSTPQLNPIDIRASANQMISRLQQGQHIEAMRVLESLRAQQPTVVQEALDRYVAAGAQEQLQGLEQMQRLDLRLGGQQASYGLAKTRLPSRRIAPYSSKRYTTKDSHKA